jgi:hypothetical protein
MRATRASTARPPTTPPTIAPTGVCRGLDVCKGVVVGDVVLGRLVLLVLRGRLLVKVELVVVGIAPQLDSAW